MPEVGMGKATASSDDSGIQSPDCRPDYSEDNDNSVSVYLDANEDCWSDNDNNNVTLVVTQKVGQTDGDDTSLCSSENGDDDEDDTKEEEEEDSFLSLASVELIMKSQVGVSDLEVSTSSEDVMPVSVSPEGQHAEVPNIAVVNERQREVVYEKEEVVLSSAIQDTDVMNETVVSLENTPITETRSTTSHSFISKEDNQPKSTAKKDQWSGRMCLCQASYKGCSDQSHKTWGEEVPQARPEEREGQDHLQGCLCTKISQSRKNKH